jgi:hypothetical protein
MNMSVITWINGTRIALALSRYKKIKNWKLEKCGRRIVDAK